MNESFSHTATTKMSCLHNFMLINEVPNLAHQNAYHILHGTVLSHVAVRDNFIIIKSYSLCEGHEPI